VNALQQYRGYQSETAGQEEQVALLYDGARRFVDKAEVALTAGKLDEASLNTGKAQRILEELASSLDMQAGEIAVNLTKLYDYWCWRLGQALIKRDSSAYREVSLALMDLHGAWVEAARTVRMARGVRTSG